MNTKDEIAGYSAYELASMADCLQPDSLTSPGAVFLDNVRDAFVERYADGSFDDRATHEIADDAPSVFTFTLWQEFTDLGAWREDISDFTEPSEDMNRNASIALYIIAERLVHALQAELEDGE